MEQPKAVSGVRSGWVWRDSLWLSDNWSNLTPNSHTIITHNYPWLINILPHVNINHYKALGYNLCFLVFFAFTGYFSCHNYITAHYVIWQNVHVLKVSFGIFQSGPYFPIFLSMWLKGTKISQCLLSTYVPTEIDLFVKESNPFSLTRNRRYIVLVKATKLHLQKQ